MKITVMTYELPTVMIICKIDIRSMLRKNSQSLGKEIIMLLQI